MSKLAKFLIVLSASLLLTGCDWFVRKEPVYVYIPVEILTVPLPEPVKLSDVSFDVVSYKNLNEFLAENEKRNGVVVFIAMDIYEYQAMATNVTELERYIEQQLATIQFYENAIAASKRQAEDLNSVQETDKDN